MIMVQRIVGKPIGSAVSQQAQRPLFWLLVVPVAGIAVAWKNQDATDAPAWITALILLMIFLMVARRTKETDTRVAVVDIYPIGVQLVMTTTTASGPTLTATGKEPLFLPRDEIVDCIVNEHILAHRVESVVLLRVRRRRSDHSSPIQLVQAFPGTEMTYVECLAARSEIMKNL
jgi:hypothetical protein